MATVCSSGSSFSGPPNIRARVDYAEAKRERLKRLSGEFRGSKGEREAFNNSSERSFSNLNRETVLCGRAKVSL